jgi:hypothetical protein
MNDYVSANEIESELARGSAFGSGDTWAQDTMDSCVRPQLDS